MKYLAGCDGIKVRAVVVEGGRWVEVVRLIARIECLNTWSDAS